MKPLWYNSNKIQSANNLMSCFDLCNWKKKSFFSPITCTKKIQILDMILKLSSKIRSLIRNSVIFKTSLMPFCNSWSWSLCNLDLSPLKMASFLFNLTQIMNGKPNLFLYFWLRLAISVFSSEVIWSSLAAECSLVLSTPNWPDLASRPARSGYILKIPSCTENNRFVIN